MIHTPDRYVILKIDAPGQETLHKVFASWVRGYTTGDTWRMNSGIVEVSETDTHYIFSGDSGSTYKCLKGSEGTSGFGYSALQGLKEKALAGGVKLEVVSVDTIK